LQCTAGGGEPGRGTWTAGAAARQWAGAQQGTKASHAPSAFCLERCCLEESSWGNGDFSLVHVGYSGSFSCLGFYLFGKMNHIQECYDMPVNFLLNMEREQVSKV